MKFVSPLIPGTLVKKYRRFLVDVKLTTGKIVTAHCPTMGTMNGCCEPGSPVMLSDSHDPSRRNQLTWELVQVNNAWVGVNAAVPGKVLYEAIESRTLQGFSDFHEIQRDASYGRGSKIALVLHGMEQNCFINVYSVTWGENGIALFPDAPSARIAKSVRELTEIAGNGHRAVAFFLIQRNDCTIFKPAEQVDRDFLKAILAAQSGNVEILAHCAHITMEEITLGDTLPYSLQ
ncbi:MAG: sfsA [Bacteroidetes bacterium]|nr:sfsA [Bacteroidota bacterium]